MKPAIFLQAAQNIDDFVTSMFDRGFDEGAGCHPCPYICHALNKELGNPSGGDLPEDYNEIVKLFEPTIEEERSFEINSQYHLTYGYFGHPNPLHQAERILACLFMYWIAKDVAADTFEV